MGISRTPKENIPLVKGSTKTILLELFKTHHNIKQIPSTDPSLSRAVLLDAQTAQAGRAIMTSPNRLNETIEASASTIDKVRGEFKLSLQSRLNSLKGQIKGTSLKREQLKDEYVKLIAEQNKKIHEIFSEKAEGKKSTDEVMRELTTLAKKEYQFSDAVKDHLKEYKNLETDLDKLHIEAYRTVQDKDKAGLPLPAHEKAETQRRKIT